MSELPEPLTPSDCDLRDFPFMPLEVRRLRDSDLAANEDPEACWAAVLLWCASWHQLPAASLPDDDRVLANLAGYGRVVAAWRKVRAGALRGFVKCADGRLYHPVAAEKANESWISKLRRRWTTECARVRKVNQRGGTEEAPEFGAYVQAVSPETVRFRPDIFGSMSRVTPPDRPGGQPRDEGGVSRDCPEGNGIQGTGIGISLPERALSAQPPRDLAKEAWDRGVALLTSQGRSKPASARSFIGQLLRDYRLDPADLLPSIVRAESLKTPDPQAYLRQAAKALGDRKGKGVPEPVEPAAEWSPTRWRLAVDNWQATGEWGASMGPRPDEPGCLAPVNLLPSATVIPLQLRSAQ